MRTTRWLFGAGLALAAALLAAQAAAAQGKYNGEDRGRPVLPTQTHAKWQQECSGCHMAFAPGLLPAASWRKVMSGLDKHFDSDATLAPQDVAEITDHLVKYASNRWTAPTSPLRITEAEWFKTKHNTSHVPLDVWARASVKSRSNCVACHRNAERGDFDERGVKIPQ